MLRIFAETMRVNTGSRATMTAIGMSHVRTFPMDWEEPILGAEQGKVAYEITRDLWCARRQSRAPYPD